MYVCHVHGGTNVLLLLQLQRRFTPPYKMYCTCRRYNVQWGPNAMYVCYYSIEYRYRTPEGTCSIQYTCTCVHVCCVLFTLYTFTLHVIYTWLTRVHLTCTSYISYMYVCTSFTWTACNLQFVCTLTTCSTCTPADGTRYIYSNKYIQILFGTRTTDVQKK